MNQNACVRMGVIGLGFMGRTHVRAIQKASENGRLCRLAAVCDTQPERLRGLADAGGNLPTSTPGAEQLFDPAGLSVYTDARRLFDDDGVDAVSICTHTPTHVELALAAIEAGKHVLVEKPVALCSAQVERLAHAARDARRVVMPAMCMRFWPGWTWLKEAMDSRIYGRVLSAVFRRLGSAPDWAPQFYSRYEHTGGVVFDLHLHDADFILWSLGLPKAVFCSGDQDHVTTQYVYDNGPANVAAEGGWRHTPGFGFRMQYVVRMQDATAEFDLRRSPPLVLYRGGRDEVVPIAGETGYEAQMRHFVECLSGRADAARSTLADALAVTRLLEAELRSLAAREAVPVQGGAASGSTRIPAGRSLPPGES